MPAPKKKRDLVVAKQRVFLRAYAECGTILRAAEIAKTSRTEHYCWMREDPEYPTLFEHAHEAFAEKLEAELSKRIFEGIEEPVVHQGQLALAPKLDKNGEIVVRNSRPVWSKKPLTVRVFSDTLLIFKLKGEKPEKYRDNAKVEHTGAGGAPLALVVTFVQPKPEPDGSPVPE